MDFLTKAGVWRARTLLDDALNAGRNELSPEEVNACATLAKALHPAAAHEQEKEIRARWPQHAERIIKAAEPALTTADLANADPQAWIGAPFESSVFDRLGAVEVPGNVPILNLSDAEAAFLPEGAPIPLPAAAFGSATNRLFKVAILVPVSREGLRHSGAEAMLAQTMGSKAAGAIDSGFLNPAGDGASGTLPVSAAYAGAQIVSSGSDAESLRADLVALFEAFEGDLSRAALITHPTIAVQIALMQNPLGEANVKLDGTGTLFGLPLLVTRGVPFDSAGGSISLVDGSAVAYSRGRYETAIGQNATLEMDSEPTNKSAPSGSVAETTQVSMFQTNTVAIRVIAEIGWSVHGDNRVVTLTGCYYGLPS